MNAGVGGGHGRQRQAAEAAAAAAVAWLAGYNGEPDLDCLMLNVA